MNKDPRAEVQRRALEEMGKDARRDRLGRFMRSKEATAIEKPDGVVSPTDEERKREQG